MEVIEALAHEPWSSAAKFSTDRDVLFSEQEENGIGSVIGVEAAALEERVDAGGRKSALMKQIMSEGTELARIWRGQFQAGLGPNWIGLG